MFARFRIARFVSLGIRRCVWAALMAIVSAAVAFAKNIVETMRLIRISNVMMATLFKEMDVP